MVVDPYAKTTAPQTMEQGFGTCSKCGKKTMGKSNTRCSRCEGTPVWESLGIPQDDLPHIPFGTIETTYVVDGVRHVKRGYPARYYRYVRTP
jgi:hypothetical protein